MATVQTHAFKMYRKEFMKLRAEMSPVAFKLMKKIANSTCARLRDLNVKIMRELSGEHEEEQKQEEARGAKEGLTGLWNRLFGRPGS